MRNNDMRAFIEEWLSRQGTDENYMVAKARAALAAPAPVAQSDHETWRAELWELIDGYRKGHDCPLAMRGRIKAHIAKEPRNG